MLTEIPYAFAQNPTARAYESGLRASETQDKAGGSLALAPGVHTVAATKAKASRSTTSTLRTGRWSKPALAGVPIGEARTSH